MLRMSTLLGRTLREDPADAEVQSHRLLVRAGFIRRVAPGIYTWLPLGLRVLDRVAAIVREEMNGIGGQEVLFPALLPRELYEITGRWTEYGDLLFKLQDRRGADYLLGPTHEELFTTLVKSECSSYRDLPLILYQVQTKYRDEARPRAGLLRAREFVMKDSYSFDLDDDGLRHSYALHRGAYERTFRRLGLDYRIVQAVSGAMGGSASEEFLAPAPTGEDSFVSCSECGYAANVEAVELRPPPPQDPAAWPSLEVLDTPDTPTIDTLAKFLQVDASDTLKNVVLMLRWPDGSTEPIVVGVPGDREIDLKRLEANVSPAEVLPADVDTIDGLVKGYIGPQGLPPGLRYVVDPLVVEGSSWVTGANQEGRHARNVVMGRDFVPAGVLPAAEVRDGDLCARCGGPLVVQRGIEIGHIFQLGRKYTDAFAVDVLGPDGKPVRLTMGSYGIGVSRAVAAIAEQGYDEKGLVWPRSVAPADMHVIPLGKGAPREVASGLAEELESRGWRVVLDDRGVSAGVAFADAELIGIPTIVVAGRGVADGVVEVRDRREGRAVEVPLEGAVDSISVLAGG
jgi:prolyl-tRNA synthetase